MRGGSFNVLILILEERCGLVQELAACSRLGVMTVCPHEPCFCSQPMAQQLRASFLKAMKSLSA